MTTKTTAAWSTDAEIYRSAPGIAEITGARVLAEFGNDPTRYPPAKSRKTYAGTCPVTRAWA